MGPKTPPTIRKEVIRGLLTGLTRDEIAKNNSIGAGTVSAIIKECREVDPDFDLLRELAISLRRDSLSVGDFASIVRLRALFIEWGLLGDSRIEEFIEKVNIYCFRAGIPPENFVDLVHKVISMTDQLETSVDRLPSEIQRKQEKLKRLQRGVKLIGKLMEHLHTKYKVTKEDIADYRTNKPLLVDENTRLRTENEILKQENSALRRE